ncbi:MAG: type II toxin-antitoxin system Phd/YefM family antitoxin [Chloroflexota bacterium]|nr:type II toxin-antitoxin system Phd/YefM family antitoxin [Chloroflexota bacterium]
MKTVSVRELSHNGVSKVVTAAEAEPVLISKNNEPAVWMVSANELARVAARLGGDESVYRGALALVAVDLFDRGTLSMGRAARLAGLPLDEFIDLCGRMHVPMLRQPPEGFEAELAAFNAQFSAAEDDASLAAE